MDWIIVAALVIVIAFDTLRSGSNRASALALALPTTLLVREQLSSAAFVSGLVGQFSTPLLQVVLFAILFVPLYFFSYRIIGAWGSSSGRPVEALLTGLASTAIVVIVWLSIPALDAVWHFGPQAQYVFSESYRFWWLLVSYGALAFARS